MEPRNKFDFLQKVNDMWIRFYVNKVKGIVVAKYDTERYAYPKNIRYSNYFHGKICAKAICNPSDEFNLKIGVNLAKARFLKMIRSLVKESGMKRLNNELKQYDAKILKAASRTGLYGFNKETGKVIPVNK